MSEEIRNNAAEAEVENNDVVEVKKECFGTKIKNFIKNNWKTAIGLIVAGIMGFLFGKKSGSNGDDLEFINLYDDESSDDSAESENN